ncbi:MAG: hypothetical protein F4X57_01445 [Chloroflexi bacterium]|nr:hypothetical protein [Chloroflexota bacterium]
MPNPDDNPRLVQDCETLLAAKDALRGNAELNWSADTAMSGWTGVTVGGDPLRVTSVNLANRGLSGVIPSQLGSLPSLTTLYLHRNALTGEIPAELGNLSNLQGLYIQRNQLTGEIPSALGDLSNMTTLYLTNNGFTGCIPAPLRDVQNSDLSSTYLPFCADEPTPEPEQDSGCSNSVAVPNPESTPGLLQDCEILLSTKDEFAGDSPLNWSADIPMRQWDGIGVGSRVFAIVLSEHESHSHGVIPPQFGNLSRLQMLLLRDVDLKGPIPPELSKLSNLWRLILEDNQLTGPIPPELGNLSNLYELRLFRNQLTGPIPPELGNLSNLEELYLYGNQLTGEIPPELGSLSKLQRLRLGWNQLTGEIPSELGNLSKLQLLSLQDNQLTGEIPTELANLPNLTYLGLSGNQLSGCFPSHPPYGFTHDFFASDGLFCDRDTLTAFYNATGGKSWTRSDNWLSDRPLGEWHGVTTDADGRVVRLELRDNNLVGKIPPYLSHLGRIEVLALDGNHLSGTIPHQFRALRNLTRLALNRNNLEGRIPGSLWWDLKNLSVLGLAKNEDISGPVPAGLGSLSNLTKLSLHDTGLSGPLPVEMANLSKLERLAIQNTGLCVPRYDDTEAWLAGIEDTGDIDSMLCESPRAAILDIEGEDNFINLAEAADGIRFTGTLTFGMPDPPRISMYMRPTQEIATDTNQIFVYYNTDPSRRYFRAYDGTWEHNIVSRLARLTPAQLKHNSHLFTAEWTAFLELNPDYGRNGYVPYEFFLDLNVPTLESATLTGDNAITLTFSEPLDTSNPPGDHNAYTVQVDGSPGPAVQHIGVTLPANKEVRQITLHLAEAVPDDGEITLEYDPSATNWPLQDVAGNPMEAGTHTVSR